MGTVDWRQIGSLSAVIVAMVAVSATTMISCGSNEGSSDGKLCQQCGDTDGPCISPITLPADDDDRPAFCVPGESCNVSLRCVRKIDSAQRRCFPADPRDNNSVPDDDPLDVDFECDGERPVSVPIATLTATPTPQPTLSPTPTSTAPTPLATSLTPTPTATTPSPATTPSTQADVDIDIDFPDDDGEFNGAFSISVSYPTAKGSFRNGGTVDCESDETGFTKQDAGNGTLTLGFGGETDRFPFTVACIFHEAEGQDLQTSDLGISSQPPELTVEPDVP